MTARLALLAVPFASFLVASPRLTLDQFEAPKHLGLALLAGTLAVCGTAGGWRRHPAVIGWLGAIMLTAICSPHPVAGWLGGEEYQDGVVTCAVYAVLFLAGAAADARTRGRFRAALLLAATLAAIYALCQRAGLDPFPGERFRHVRAAAGNPDFLAQQMTLALPFALALNARGRAPGPILVAVFILVAGLTASRAGTAAAIAGLLLTGWLLRHRAGTRPRLALAAGAVVVALIAAEALVPADLTLISRLRTLAAEDGFRIARGDIWRGTTRAVTERPVTGWGPDTLGSVFLRTAPAGWADRAGLGVTARRAHSDPLHWLAAAGVTGLGAWLWVLAAALRPRRLDPDETPLTPAIAAVLLHNLVSFGTAGTLPVFWVLLGMRSRPADAPGRIPTRFTPLLLPAAILIAAIAAIRFSAGGYGYVGNEAERAKDTAAAVAPFALAARLLPLDAPMAIRAGRAAEVTGSPHEGLAWFERAATLAPIDGLTLGHVGRVRASLAGTSTAEREAAHLLLLKSIELAPSQPTLWGAAIMSAQSRGRRDEIPGLIAGMQRAAPLWAVRLLNAPPPAGR